MARQRFEVVLETLPSAERWTAKEVYDMIGLALGLGNQWATTVSYVEELSDGEVAALDKARASDSPRSSEGELKVPDAPTGINGIHTRHEKQP